MYKGSRMINTHKGNLFDCRMQRFDIDFGGEVETAGYPGERKFYGYGPSVLDYNNRREIGLRFSINCF